MPWLRESAAVMTRDRREHETAESICRWLAPTFMIDATARIEIIKA
jgi:hypothetical protein